MLDITNKQFEEHW